MNIVTLDLEGVLVPEIWIAFAEKTGIEALKRTTRDEPDYDRLMQYRMDILDEHNLTLSDIQAVIATIKPLEGAKEFLDKLRDETQVIILSDTFTEFALPLMRQLDHPTILCNSLVIDDRGMIRGIKMRTDNGKKKSVAALRSVGCRVFASGDSYNDLAMIREADDGCLFRAPRNIIETEKDLSVYETYDELLSRIEGFLNG